MAALRAFGPKSTSFGSSNRPKRLRTAGQSADKPSKMSVWVWLGIGAAGFFVVATVVALSVASILGRIAEDVRRLAEDEVWRTAPLARDEECDDLAPRRALRRLATGRSVRSGRSSERGS
jgi:hypothetical protein